MTCSFSVICPVWNEQEYIDSLCEFIASSQRQPVEVLLIDGGSSDETIERIQAWQQRLPNLRLLHNPDRYVPFALNLAIPECSGAVIIRLDAHSDFSEDYFDEILATFERTGADIVGGPTRVRWKTPFQQAVGIAISDPFGIGNSRVHQIDYEGPTDSVTFGAWRKEVFDQIGLFDTRLARNQDDEFHYRARSAGLTVYQSPSIRLYYYPRRDLKGLFKQYFQYGLYKPLVLRKVRSAVSIRHLVPSLFVLYLLLLPVGLAIHWFAAAPLAAYLLLLISKSLTARAPWRVRLLLLTVFPTIHIAYGLGFLCGIWAVFARGIERESLWHT